MFEMRAGTVEVRDPLTPYREIPRHTIDGRAWVLANMVAGLDGTAAVNGRVSALSTPLDFELFKRLRGLADVILVGAETVRQETYGPVVLDDDLDVSRRTAGLGPPRLAIVSSSLDLDPDLPVFSRSTPDARPIVVTTEQSDVRRLSETDAQIIVAGHERVDMRAAIEALTAMSYGVVLCEGGPTLLGQLVAADLLDEYCLTMAPVVGGDPLPVIDAGAVDGVARFVLNHVYSDGSTLFLNYLRDRRP